LVQVLLGLLDWRAGGKYGLCAQMKWNESEASVGRVLAVEVVSAWNCRSLSVVRRLISFL
jgi:DnaJ family protein C protein 13